MNPRRILVTGSDGFVGGHLVRAAGARGLATLGLHRHGRCSDPARVHVDLSSDADEAELTAAMATVDGVIHCAASVKLFGAARPLVRENVGSTARLLRAAEAAGAPPFVFLSSASVLYRPGDQPELTEDTALPKRALVAYAKSKVACEQLVRGYSGRWVILRPQAIYGPGDRTLIPEILRVAGAGGWVWLGPAGRVQADLVSVYNVAGWALAAVQRDDAHGVFLLSDGAPRPIEDLLGPVFRAAGLSVPKRRLPRRLAAAGGALVEGAYRVVAPRHQPPLTRFAAEVLGATRVASNARAVRFLGPPAVCSADAFKELVESIAAR